MRITKAIIPVAGFGTRFLPATKAQPKEMLPVVDKPIIQYIVEEAVAAGIKQIILITSQNKRALEDHFDRNFELEYRLQKKGDKKTLGAILDITDLAQFVYVRQRSPKGDGDAILQARDIVGNEPCAVFFGDDLVDAKVPAIKQLMNTYEKYGDPVVCVTPRHKNTLHRYGVIGGVSLDSHTLQIKKFVEKPAPGKAPSNLAVFGRYIITPAIFEMLANQKPRGDQEIRLADALAKYAEKHALYAHILDGTPFDCGNKADYVNAILHFGLKHPEVRDTLRKTIRARHL
ncbi:UTP--glucose-1-phosphate uridylyltransferase [Candidatus Uhrbacteria bacterium RIFCSPLOWO2_02_FULL_51_9]|uniref:UTP--glucose-1-phosphate uridylyltransferase n=1 Tax=Candidatus Uhrbacteria bacterium RIFCSPLOWO2_02_FULL_51_9 TaxID=1802410 RepID=A0A1F7VED3_9BACT|nr:MAG: UTP--glucose-1-phosphate uridylyltransferase [Candidatus Uhrbacteria bacterium RIFCSPLOWO2_02_FULL_51_9]